MSTWTSITTSPVPTRRLGGLAIDGIVICAIGTLSLSALGENIGPLLILAVASVAWSIVLVLVIGRRVFAREWFERSIAEFGEGRRGGGPRGHERALGNH